MNLQTEEEKGRQQAELSHAYPISFLIFLSLSLISILTREAGYLGPMEEYVDKTMEPVAMVILGMNTALRLVSIRKDLRDTVWA